MYVCMRIYLYYLCVCVWESVRESQGEKKNHLPLDMYGLLIPALSFASERHHRRLALSLFDSRSWHAWIANMGIPKFYRWLSERYPLINQNLAPLDGGTTRSTESRSSNRDQGGGEFNMYQDSLTRLHRRQGPCPAIDNLYLDFNGVVHNATHGPGSRLRQHGKVWARMIDHLVDTVCNYDPIPGIEPVRQASHVSMCVCLCVCEREREREGNQKISIVFLEISLLMYLLLIYVYKQASRHYTDFDNSFGGWKERLNFPPFFFFRWVSLEWQWVPWPRVRVSLEICCWRGKKYF